MKRKSLLFVATVLVAITVFLNFCTDGVKEDPLPDVAVNPEFEMNPPTPKSVGIKRIKGDDEHILVIATFDKGVLNRQFLAIGNDSAKTILRDDGKGGDEQAGDGLFTVKLKQSVSEIEQFMSEQAKAAATEETPVIFVGRSIKTDTAAIRKDRFNIEAFKTFKLADISFITRFLNIAKLRQKSLMVIDPKVVEDPNRTWNVCAQRGNIDGPWTFKTLMRHLASTDPANLVNDVQLSDFVENWLRTWINSHPINGENLPGRFPMSLLISTWKQESQNLPDPKVPVGKLDMRIAPFKLTAIVNRLDLRGNSAYGVSNGGEGRFVFCLVRHCVAEEFNIIFEYGVPKKKCAALKAYAKQWYNLKDLTVGSDQYNQQLQAITDQFTKCGTSPAKPNNSSLNQLRSNEIALGNVWQLREFVLDAKTHQLKDTTVKQEPAVKFNAKNVNADVARLVRYIKANETAILNTTHTVPLAFENAPFLGGKAHTLFPPVGNPANSTSPNASPHHWNGTGSNHPDQFIPDNDARQNFSLNTCSGCHGGETQTAFTMIDPVPFGTQATLAGFLTGTPGRSVGGVSPVDLDGNNGIMFIPDPAARASSADRRKFNDLQRRAIDLENFATTPCRGFLQIREALLFKPLRMTH